MQMRLYSGLAFCGHAQRRNIGGAKFYGLFGAPKLIFELDRPCRKISSCNSLHIRQGPFGTGHDLLGNDVIIRFIIPTEEEGDVGRVFAFCSLGCANPEIDLNFFALADGLIDLNAEM